jgi:hypothetical protein
MSVSVLERPALSRRPTGAAERLLGQARRTLAEASASTDPADRYAGAHLAALHTAAALLADRPAVATGRRSRRPTSAWKQLDARAPELADWTSRFATGAAKRAAALAGLDDAVTELEAVELCHHVQDFIALAEARLGMLPLDAQDRGESPSAPSESRCLRPLR